LIYCKCPDEKKQGNSGRKKLGWLNVGKWNHCPRLGIQNLNEDLSIRIRILLNSIPAGLKGFELDGAYLHPGIATVVTERQAQFKTANCPPLQKTQLLMVDVTSFSTWEAFKLKARKTSPANNGRRR